MTKKLVRLALASEYSRQPIRRTDIAAKGQGGRSWDTLWDLVADGSTVLAPSSGRQFKYIFNEAQTQLRTVFGMELTELPQKEKITISQKRGSLCSPLICNTS